MTHQQFYSNTDMIGVASDRDHVDRRRHQGHQRGFSPVSTPRWEHAHSQLPK